MMCFEDIILFKLTWVLSWLVVTSTQYLKKKWIRKELSSRNCSIFRTTEVHCLPTVQVELFCSNQAECHEHKADVLCERLPNVPFPAFGSTSTAIKHMLDAVICKNHFSLWNILFMLEMVRMNGLFIPLQKGAWNLQEFWHKIPGYPGFFVHAEKPGKSLEKPGVAGFWKSLKSQENIFHALQAFPYVQKSLERPRKPGTLVFSWLSGLFRVFLEGARTVSFTWFNTD